MAAPVEPILVDARAIAHPTAGAHGIGRHVTGLLHGLIDVGAEVVALCETHEDAETVGGRVDGLVTDVWSPRVVVDRAGPSTWYLATQLMLHPIPLDPIPSAVTRAGLPVAALMYDVIPYRHPDLYLRHRVPRSQAQLRRVLAGTLDVLLANSEFVRTTAADELGYPLERIRTVGLGVTPNFCPPSVVEHPWPERVVPRSIGRFVVAVTGLDERKNTEGLLRAWAQLPERIRREHHLVVPTSHTPSVLDRWRRSAADAGVLDEVTFTGWVTDDEMVALLQRAELAVVPSLEEGFGLPVIEAAACGCPVICSGTSSLPEILDEPRACFDPISPGSIAAAITAALDDDDGRRAVLRAAGERAVARWQWPRVAADVVAAIGEIGPRRPVTATRTPAGRLGDAPRVALAGPFAASASGVGAYDERVAAALVADGRIPQLELFVDTSGTAQPPGPGRRNVRAFDRFAKPWDYDHVVAALGSSTHHVATAQLAERVPCHVWLHEASLVGVYVGLAHLSGSSAWGEALVRDVIQRSESEPVAAAALAGPVVDAPRLDRLGVRLLGPVLDRARSVIVSSDAAAATIRTLRPHGPAIVVIPLAHPPAAAAPAVPATLDVVAAGWLADNKAPLVAIDVLVRLRDAVDARLHFVGPVADGARDTVEAAARAAGVSDAVEITGRLDDDEYQRRIGLARAGLQLRTGAGGEMSAAITDLQAKGIPTVTTMRSALPSSPGLQVVDLDAAALAAALTPLLDDDATWTHASQDALARASAWTFDDVAAALAGWLADVDALDPATIRRCGPPAATPDPR